MITKEEILDHLDNTLYSKGARKSIIGYLAGAGYDYTNVEFAERRCSAREERAHTFEDFLAYLHYGKYAEEMGRLDSTFGEAANSFWNCVDISFEDEFKVGDWVKYIPEPGESSTECIEAIAHGADGKMYLCLSNGEYVRPCYCVKYKVQGEERHKLIDKLNEVI